MPFFYFLPSSKFPRFLMKENCASASTTGQIMPGFFKYFDTLRCYENAFLLLVIIIFAIIGISKISSERELGLLLLRLDRLCLVFFQVLRHIEVLRKYLSSSACHHHLCHHRNFKDF
ncbi:hypothetical protein CDAR_179181 [Caerostris darwini]|uniref:Uncharacterized protein n=1 Tax=Caerostris darwini TaxID=1538125 RepID=A0AAV4PD09_9ARAC|nr:hypothetical protein CDAR_179181 [Caerostris darwini]